MYISAINTTITQHFLEIYHNSMVKLFKYFCFKSGVQVPKIPLQIVQNQQLQLQVTLKQQ